MLLSGFGKLFVDFIYKVNAELFAFEEYLDDRMKFKFIFVHSHFFFFK